MKLIIAIALVCSALPAEAALVNRTTYNAGTNALASQIAAKQGIIWTNSAGIVTPAGGQSATNRLQFVSGAADNATNVAAVIGAPVWAASGAKHLVSKRGGTNTFGLAPHGGMAIGANAENEDFYGNITPEQWLLAYNIPGLGDPETLKMEFGVIGDANWTNAAESTINSSIATSPRSLASFTAYTDTETSTWSMFAAVGSQASGSALLFTASSGNEIPVGFWPKLDITSAQDAARIGPHIARTNLASSVFTVHNAYTNLLEVGVSGALKGRQVPTEPDAPAAGRFTLFAIDNGSGKMVLKVKFPTGPAQEIKIEP